MSISGPSAIVIGSDAQAEGGSIGAVNATVPGRIGVSIGFPFELRKRSSSGNTDQLFDQGVHKELMRITFTVSPTATPNSQTPVTFADTPDLREVSSQEATVIPANFTDGFVNILATAAAGVIVGGKVLLEDSQRSVSRVAVTLTDSNGVVRSTQSNIFGYFQFDGLQAGQVYTIGVRSKEYSSPAQIISVNDSISDIELSVQPR